MALECCKAYDIRGRVPETLNADIAYRLGKAFAQRFNPGKVVVGGDVRDSSEMLVNALSHGLVDGGAEVTDIGLCGTEEIYFATFHGGFGGGIMVTASHNPLGYNGMKLVREGARPISGDTGLRDLEADVEASSETPPAGEAPRQRASFREAYVKHLLGYLKGQALPQLKIVVTAGNGCAGPVIDALEPHLPSVEFIKVHHTPDGTFPNGIPNPLLPENRPATAEAVKQQGADLGVAWDGDFDRCFLFDERGEFIEGYYIVGLLAEAMLAVEPGAKIIHDPRLTWNTIDQVQAAGGEPVQSKTGHAFIKERMRKENAIYGGEMSAHHYFRDFAYCDNGMIPWLLVAALMGAKGQKLSELVRERMAAYPASGEINRRVDNIPSTIARIESHFADQNPAVDRTDGLSMEFDQWRFNLRASNTEPVLRLNVESRADSALMQAKTDEILGLIGGVA